MKMFTDEDYMKLALAEAQKAAAKDEVPVGAVLVLDGRIIGKGHNMPITGNDPSAHAEMLAIRKAAKKLDNYRLTGAELYVTLEPCIMCAGAIVQARIKRVIFGATDPKSGAVSSLYQILADKRLNHHVEVTAGILREECGEILSRFFRGKRVLSAATADK